MPSLDIVIPAHNAECCLEPTLEAIFRQTVPRELILGVIVVNNRSTDRTGELIEKWADEGVRRIDHYVTESRSSTLNAGVAASKAEYVLILDSDCRLVGHGSLRVAARAMAEDIDAGFGYATGSSDNFWGRYHRSLEVDRATAGWQGWTTACCLIKRELFESVGGFSIDYRHYGFEDRDLICRLRSTVGDEALKSLPDLQAVHDDDTTIQNVCKKMYKSGRYSSGIFKRNFPDEYLSTMYAYVDTDTAPKQVAFMLRLLQPLQPILVQISAWLTDRRHTPIGIGRPVVRLCSALSYFQGTVDRNRGK